MVVDDGRGSEDVVMKTATIGYSGTPLAKKLGLKSGMRLFAVAAPPHLGELLADAPSDLVWLAKLAPFDVALSFARSTRDWTTSLATLEAKLAADGMIWAAWPKRTSGVTTDLTENIIRQIGPASGLVDVKVCAIDTTWSGLKFARRVRDRPL